MAWLKIDDRVRTHPKIAEAGPAAAWLWFCGICYCREHLTDGFIPGVLLGALAMNLPAAKKHATKLVEVGLWELRENGYYVHDFLDWNPSRADVEAGRDWETQRKGLYRDKDLTKLVRQRDGDTCRYCGVVVNWADRRGARGGQHDHVVPRGPSTLENVVVACRECNILKANRTPEEAGMSLIPVLTQVIPRSDQVIVTRSASRDRAGDAGSGSVLGLGDLALREESPRETPAADPPDLPRWTKATAREPHVVDGVSARRHAAHAWCSLPREGLCVPEFLHVEFIGKGGKADAALRAWYGATLADVDDLPIGEDALKFWRARFAAWVGSATAPAHRNASPRAKGMAWSEECARLHGGTCEGQYQHGLAMRVIGAIS